MINQSGYDIGTSFSPEGRIFQVEYAREAVSKGVIVIGINAIDGVVIAVDRRKTSPLVKIPERIAKIDNHIIAAATGIIPDSRELIDRARYEAQVHRVTYDEQINTEALVKHLCDAIHFNTSHGGLRPFGVSLLIAGIDENKTRLFETDPSGAFWECNATAIGTYKDKITEVLEKKYTDNITVDESIELIKKIMVHVSPTSIEPEIFIYRKV